jgi:soluble calcium-activated nucleotidase 1
MLIASEDFNDIEVVKVGVKTETRGFSSFKFIPSRPNEIVALKTEEKEHKMKSYITVFDITGRVLLKETKIGDEKFEGIEII